MAVAYLGLGTNLGNKRRNLITAAALVAERVGDILALSDFYETEPWGYDSENKFLNAAIKIRTDHDPHSLLEITQAIEKELGRTKKSEGFYQDRIVDIDILLYDDIVLEMADLQIPHPLMTKRKFVMDPLSEIAPSLLHPTLKVCMKDLNEQI